MYGDESCDEHHLSLGLGFFRTLMKTPHGGQMRILRENSGISPSFLSSTLEEDGPVWKILCMMHG